MIIKLYNTNQITSSSFNDKFMEFRDPTNIAKPAGVEKETESIETISPAIESFLNPVYAAKTWPSEITHNKNFQEQVEKRKELRENLETVLKNIPRPDISLEDAISHNYTNEDQVAKLYTSLNNLLESDSDYRRIILYLPFEFLPNISWNPSSDILKQASNQFRCVYMETWKNCLSTYDVRANFVDGDILETENRTGDHPRVVKAAHLIPKLIEKGFMNVSDVIGLMEESDDQILKDSIADTLPVLADLGFITEKEIALMQNSKDRLINNMAIIITSNINSKKEESIENSPKVITLSHVQENLSEQLSHIDTKNYGNITEKRKDWLKQEQKQKTINILGEEISTTIIENALEEKEIENFLTENASNESQQALVEGIRKAIEAITLTDIEKAQALYEKYKETLMTLWKNTDTAVNEATAKTFRRLNQLNIVDEKQLTELDISLPRLAGPFSENLPSIKKELQDIQKMTASIESNPELSKLIYPVTLAYGSQIKGYGEKNSDIDLGVFVKPGTSLDDQEKLQGLLKQTFNHEKIRDEVVAFWLEESESQLTISDLESFGKSYWTHILFGAVWEGDKKIIHELREKLLTPYLYETEKIIRGHDARSLYLEEIERDTLQYRLMHKGYERFYPSYGGIHTPHADEIDGESMFWDSGYRQLATKLFISRVFLPKIPVPEK